MEERLLEIREALVTLNERQVLDLVRAVLEQGAAPLAVLRACEEGMREIGERYERRQYFLSALIMAGEIFRQVLDHTQPLLRDELAGNASGRVLLGTAAGDIHDIGKNMAALALRAFGFTVEDLGVNVAPQAFLEAARDFRPDVIAVSALISTAFNSMRNTVAAVREHEVELGGRTFVLIGGGRLDSEVARFVGADSWTTDAMEGVRICQALMAGRPQD
jgi:methanogenic corrinoid protein MtbC1